MKIPLHSCICLFLATTLLAQSHVPLKASVLDGIVVRDPGGAAVRKAEVQLIAEAQEEESSNYTTTTDAEGHFKIEGIRPGRYRAFVERAGFVQVDKHNRRSPGVALSFEPGKDVNDLQLRMLPAAVIVGRVVDEDGDPMPRTDVSVMRYGYSLGRRHLETTASGATNDLGEYRVPDLLPGHYLVSANPPPDFSTLSPSTAAKPEPSSKQETAYGTTFYPGTTDRNEATVLDLRAGEETPVNFNLAPGPTFHVRGTVVDAGSGGVAGAVLTLHPKDSNSEFTAAQVGKDGKFEIAHVPPGSYTLTAVVGPSDAHRMARQSLEVSAGDLNDVRLVIAPGSRIRGQLRVEGRRTVEPSSLVVFFRSNDGEFYRFGGGEESGPPLTRVKRDGTFELKNVVAGTYTVLIEGGAQDFFLKAVKLAGTDVTNTGLTIADSASYSLDLVVAAGAGAIDGNVIDTDGHGIADAVVVAVPSGEHRGRLDLYGRGVTDQYGRFSIAGLTPGDFTLFAFETMEDGEYYDAAFLKPYEASSAALHLDEGGRRSLQLKVIPTAGEDRE